MFLSLIFLLSLEGLIENNCYKEVGIFVVLLGIMWYLVKKKVSLKDLEKISGINLNED
nr:MAG TPA: Cbb3-type cytochrome c oxidase subunit [Crassvirales sp.]